jgi:lipopolysaccharide/colanic/teichoic acid biosynthesis glycosyltransferase
MKVLLSREKALARQNDILWKMIRRLFDLILALFWLLLASPISFLIAILIKFDSIGPILYTPQMIRRNGKPFRVLRFRTMHIDQMNLATEERFTRVGRFIRHYSLDHLPMLINLIKGDLTIVGPRPMEKEAVDLHDPIWGGYFQVKPGLFNYAVLKLGSAWTSSRLSRPALNQELELEYLKKRSPVFDLKLFWEFLRAHLVSRGNVKARGKPDLEVESRLNKQ